MASVIDICNRALSQIGDEIGITSIDDDSKPARYCKLLYADTRDYLLRSYPWRFSLKKWRLAPVEEKPLYRFKNAFQLPTDCLRIWRLEKPLMPYEVVGKRVEANTDVFSFLGCARIEDTTQFDAMFTEALVLRLAVELAQPLTGDTNKESYLLQKYTITAQEAKTATAMEGMQDTYEILPSFVTDHLEA